MISDDLGESDQQTENFVAARTPNRNTSYKYPYRVSVTTAVQIAAY